MDGMDDSVVVLIGGGGHALVVAAAARDLGVRVAGFVDDNAQAPLATLACAAWLGAISSLGERVRSGAVRGDQLIMAIGSLAARRRVLQALQREGVTPVRSVCHTSAVVDPSARLAGGVFVGPRAVVQAHAVVGAQGIINSGAIVEHECVLGENVHIAPGAILAGNVRVGVDSLVGVGARVLPGVAIGTGSVVGAGSVVTRDVGDGVTVVGAPARVVGG